MAIVATLTQAGKEYKSGDQTHNSTSTYGS
jgi:hypothetical protein